VNPAAIPTVEPTLNSEIQRGAISTTSAPSSGTVLNDIEQRAQAVGNFSVAFVGGVLVAQSGGVGPVPESVHQLGQRGAGNRGPRRTRASQVVEVQTGDASRATRLRPLGAKLRPPQWMPSGLLRSRASDSLLTYWARWSSRIGGARGDGRIASPCRQVRKPAMGRARSECHSDQRDRAGTPQGRRAAPQTSSDWRETDHRDVEELDLELVRLRRPSGTVSPLRPGTPAQLERPVQSGPRSFHHSSRRPRRDGMYST
jgi:hypothetical protein